MKVKKWLVGQDIPTTVRHVQLKEMGQHIIDSLQTTSLNLYCKLYS